MKTPDEIKKDIIDCMDEAIVVSESGDAHDLLNFSDKAHVCMAVTLTYIQQLEANHSKVKAELKRLTQNHIEDMKIICKLERERDAAVADIKASQSCSLCIHCPKDDECETSLFLCMECDKVGCVCRECFHGEKLEWRGVCPENTEVQENDH